MLELQSFFEENEFAVHLSEQDGVQCAEVEKWTNGGVDMIIWLNPFTAEEFKSYVNDFDVDEEIDDHRGDQKYKDAFTITQSVKDFTDFHNHLKEIVLKLDKINNPVPEIPAMDLKDMSASHAISIIYTDGSREEIPLSKPEYDLVGPFYELGNARDTLELALKKRKDNEINQIFINIKFHYGIKLKKKRKGS